MNLSQKTFPLLLLVAGLAFGYTVGMRKGEDKINSKVTPVLTEARKYFQPIPDFSAVSGRVLEIKDNKLVLEASIPQNPFEVVPTRRSVVFNNSTKFVKLINKNAAGYEKEVEEYQKRLKASAGETISVKPPSLTEETSISVSEIVAGDIILAEAGESIKTKDAFDAIKILLQSHRENLSAESGM